MSNERDCRFSYSPIVHRPRLEMPNDARVAVWIGVNIEYYDFNDPIGTARGSLAEPPSPDGFGWYQYGLRVGVFRLMAMMSEHGFRGSVLLNSDVGGTYPEIIDEGNARGWVWLGHGSRNLHKASEYTSVDEERTAIRRAIEEITACTGQVPHGWLGPGLSESHHTPDLLAEAGLTYVCDWVADDQPFSLDVKNGTMINIPYAIDGLNDMRLRDRAFTGGDYHRLIVDQFDQLYADGAANPRIMCIAIHPHITGQPFRAINFGRALEYIAGHAGVWLATSDELAEWYYDHYYEPPSG